nr:hypothetical protein Iba_scaffold32159CG0010 [Ipomoea batatas]
MLPPSLLPEAPSPQSSSPPTTNTCRNCPVLPKKEDTSREPKVVAAWSTKVSLMKTSRDCVACHQSFIGMKKTPLAGASPVKEIAGGEIDSDIKEDLKEMEEDRPLFCGLEHHLLDLEMEMEMLTIFFPLLLGRRSRSIIISLFSVVLK